MLVPVATDLDTVSRNSKSFDIVRKLITAQHHNKIHSLNEL